MHGDQRTAFANRFRDLLHCPPGAYLHRLRLAIARRAIEAGAGLKRAAALSGYSGAATLSRALAQAARGAPPQAPPLSSASLA
jgi:AraC-like DNA-binding protein